MSIGNINQFVLMRSYFCAGPPEQFDNWLSSFSLEDKKGEISELLVNSPSIRALYTKMVCTVAFVNAYFIRSQNLDLFYATFIWQVLLFQSDLPFSAFR